MLGAAYVWRRMPRPAAPPIIVAPIRSREHWLILGLFVLGLALRLPRLGESLWFDEIASWSGFGQGGPGWIVGTYSDPANHIFHSLLTWCSVTWLGLDGFSLRLPALLFSLATILPLYWLGRDAMTPRVGYFAGLLMAVAPVAVLEGVESRGYSMMIFFAAMQSWLLLRARSRPSGATWFAYVLCAAFGAWAHLTTVFITLGHGVWVVWCAGRERQWRPLLPAGAALACAAILTVTLYAPVLPQMLEIRSTFATVEGNEPRLIGPEGLHTLLQLGGSWAWWAALPGLLLGALGVYQGSYDRIARGTLAMTLIGLPLMIVVIALGDSWLYARFTLFALPGALFAIALGMEAVWRLRPPVGFGLVALIALLAATELGLRPPKQPLRDALDAIRASSLTSQRGVAIGLSHEFEAYSGGLDVFASPQHGRDLADLLGRVQPAWVVLDYPQSVSGETYDVLRDRGFIETARLRGWVDWTNGDVVIYRRD
jgi:hypothetical protein